MSSVFTSLEAASNFCSFLLGSYYLAAQYRCFNWPSSSCWPKNSSFHFRFVQPVHPVYLCRRTRNL